MSSRLWIHVSRFAFAMIVGFVALAVAGSAQTNQGGGGGTQGGGTTGGSTGFPTTGGQSTGSTGGTGGNSDSGSSFSLDQGPIDLLANQLQLGQFTNDRIQPFVGASSLNIAHPRSFMASDGGTGGAGGFSGLTFSPAGRGGGQFGANSGLGFGSSSSINRRGIRGAITYDFTSYSSKIESAVAPYFTDRMTRLPRFADVEGLDIAMENRVATLRGTVADADQKRLLERQLLMEPGVSRVINQLQIRGSDQ